MELLGVNKVDGGKTTGIGRWVQELAWRDFYINLVVAFPRVSMGRPWLEKYAAVVWEAHQSSEKGKRSKDSTDGELLQAWKNGTTGYPIVDAAMRCLQEMGWLHNRLRMITAMFLTKNLMFDWRVGERVSPYHKFSITIFTLTFFSTLWKILLTATLRLTTVAGSGALVQVLILARISGSSTRTTRVSRSGSLDILS